MTEKLRKETCSKCGSVVRFYSESNPWISCPHHIGTDDKGYTIRCDYPFGLVYTGPTIKKERRKTMEEDNTEDNVEDSTEVVQPKKQRKKRVEKGPRKCKLCGGTGHNKATCPESNKELIDTFENILNGE